MNKHLAVANYIGYKKTKEKKHITIIELVKLCYIAHGRYLAIYNRPLLENDVIKAFPYGPVPLDIYKHFRQNGIELKQEQFSNEESFLSNEEKEIIDSTIEDYKKIDPYILSILTHKEGTPWTETVKKENLYSIISNESIKTYYKTLLKSW